MICTCGDDVGETARLWRRAVKGAGLHGDAAFSVAMPNTYVCLPGFDVDDTQTATRKLENAPTAIQGIIDKICAKSVGDFSFHGKFAFLKTRIIVLFSCASWHAKKFFHSIKKCVSLAKYAPASARQATSA